MRICTDGLYLTVCHCLLKQQVKIIITVYHVGTWCGRQCLENKPVVETV